MVTESKTTFELCGFTQGTPWTRWVCQSYASASARVERYQKEYPRCDEIRITEVTETTLFILRVG